MSFPPAPQPLRTRRLPFAFNARIRRQMRFAIGAMGCTGDATDLKGVMNINGWNYIPIMARGPALLHLLNGRLIAATIDNDPVRRKMNGRIAVQIEGLGEVYFRGIWLKSW